MAGGGQMVLVDLMLSARLAGWIFGAGPAVLLRRSKDLAWFSFGVTARHRNSFRNARFLLRAVQHESMKVWPFWAFPPYELAALPGAAFFFGQLSAALACNRPLRLLVIAVPLTDVRRRGN